MDYLCDAPPASGWATVWPEVLEDENARLKRLVADLTLERQILQEVVRKGL